MNSSQTRWRGVVEKRKQLFSPTSGGRQQAQAFPPVVGGAAARAQCGAASGKKGFLDLESGRVLAREAVRERPPSGVSVVLGNRPGLP